MQGENAYVKHLTPCNTMKKRCKQMSNYSKNVVPEAKDALNRFKMEAAQEVGVNLKNGYNGDLTSQQAGSVGGQMVKEMCTERHLTYTRVDWVKRGQKTLVTYQYQLLV